MNTDRRGEGRHNFLAASLPLKASHVCPHKHEHQHASHLQSLAFNKSIKRLPPEMLISLPEHMVPALKNEPFPQGDVWMVLCVTRSDSLCVSKPLGGLGRKLP